MWKRMKKPLALVLAMAMLISLVSFEQLPVTAGSPETQTEASQEAKSAEASKTEGTEKKENKDTKETEESSSQKEDTSSEKESTEEEKSSEEKSTEASKDSKEESTEEDKTAEYKKMYQKLLDTEDETELKKLWEEYQKDEGFQSYIDDLDDDAQEALAEKMADIADTSNSVQAVNNGGWGGQGSGSTSSSGTEIDESAYKGTLPVYWDTTNGSTGLNQSGVSGVTLNGTTVKGANSNKSGNPGGGSSIATYYPTASAKNMKTADLVITAEPGKYVTKVVIACVPNSGTTPYKCSTWNAGNAYIANFDLSNSTYNEENGNYTLTVKDLSSRGFCHNSNDKGSLAYYILIVVADVPTPLYVEYDYGTIKDYITIDNSSVFSKPAEWTTADSKNAYASGKVLTANTQFKYHYTETSQVKNWRHYANTVTTTASTEAAAAGYYFTGWKATWYNKCSYTESSSTMSFSDTYSGPTDVKAGQAVALPTHVRLVAQWAPIQLTLKKTVTGLPENAGTGSYTVKLQKKDSSGEWKQVGKDITLSVTGNDSATKTVSATDGYTITSGEYRLVETEASKAARTVGTDTYSCTVTEGTFTVSGQSDDNCITVTNDYAVKPKDTTITVNKTVTGNMGETDKAFTFTLKLTKDSTAYTEDLSATKGTTTQTLTQDAGKYSFTLKDSESITITVPCDYQYTVAENDYSADGYTTYIGTGDSKEKTSEATGSLTEDKVDLTFTNDKDVAVPGGLQESSNSWYLLIGAAFVLAGGFGFLKLRDKKAGQRV